METRFRPAVTGARRARRALLPLALLLAAGGACEIPSGPPAPSTATDWPKHVPPAGRWRVRPEPGLTWRQVRVRCDASALGRTDVGSDESVDVAPGCTVIAEGPAGEVELRLPGGLPGEVWCDAAGACRRTP